MQRARTPEPTNATIGFNPYTTNGFVHHFTFWISTIHITVAIATAAIPAQNTTYELVHRLLLMGNDQFHISPDIMPMAPTANSPVIRSRIGKSREIQRP